MELQRKLLAAAVASTCALPAVALAQVPSWIQIYGRANVTYERITTENSSNTAALPAGQPNQSNWDLVDNSSRIGIRGNKDLGGGLTGLFQVESRVRLDSGGDFLSTRDSYAGLAGRFGTVRLGRTIGPVYYATYDYISMHNHDTGTSSDALLAPTVFGNQGFMNNTVWYTSPKFGAFTVDVAHSLLGVARVAGDQPRYLGLVGSYDQGPLHVAASYANTKNTADLGGGTANDDKAYTVGGLYDFKTFVVGALIENAESKTLAGGDAKRNYVRVSAMMPVGKNEFHVNFGTVNHGTGSSTNNDGAKQWTLGYNYNITKETKIYGFYTKVDNDSNGTYGAGNFSTVNQLVAVPGLDISSIAIGVRHNF
jgi:predicted porin